MVRTVRANFNLPTENTEVHQELKVNGINTAQIYIKYKTT